MLPPAPGLFSTMNCWPSVVLSRCATRRAVKSKPPPGAKATMIFTGLVGYCWAESGAGATRVAAVASNTYGSTRFSPTITVSSCLVMRCSLSQCSEAPSDAERNIYGPCKVTPIGRSWIRPRSRSELVWDTEHVRGNLAVPIGIPPPYRFDCIALTILGQQGCALGYSGGGGTVTT